jgi:hypothetical protein
MAQYLDNSNLLDKITSELIVKKLPQKASTLLIHLLSNNANYFHFYQVTLQIRPKNPSTAHFHLGNTT